MLPTPVTSHLTRADFDNHVYEPAEDTFILLDALEADADDLASKQPLICLEIGSGSGCVSAFVAAMRGPSIVSLCTDVNVHATRATLRTGVANKTRLDVIHGSFADALADRLRHSVDLLIFNPPYVPTTAEELEAAKAKASLAGAWAGGEDGMSVTDLFLPSVADLLSEHGAFYLVAVASNKPDRIIATMHERYSLAGEVRPRPHHVR